MNRCDALKLTGLIDAIGRRGGKLIFAHAISLLFFRTVYRFMKLSLCFHKNCGTLPLSVYSFSEFVNSQRGHPAPALVRSRVEGTKKLLQCGTSTRHDPLIRGDALEELIRTRHAATEYAERFE